MLTDKEIRQQLADVATRGFESSYLPILLSRFFGEGFFYPVAEAVLNNDEVALKDRADYVLNFRTSLLEARLGTRTFTAFEEKGDLPYMLTWATRGRVQVQYYRTYDDICAARNNLADVKAHTEMWVSVSHTGSVAQKGQKERG